MLAQSVTSLRRNLWPLLLAHLLCDTLVFILHRLSHRLTNESTSFYFLLRFISTFSVGVPLTAPPLKPQLCYHIQRL